MFGDKTIINDAQRHAHECYPQESCGLIVDGKYLKRHNSHYDPVNNFRISSQSYIWAARRGEIQGVVHSHPGGPDYPSRHDMSLQQQGKLPWLIIPTNSRPFWFGDGVPVAPYVGRNFKCGVSDCWSIIRDWYKKEKDISLMDLPRDMEWWNNGEDLYMANLTKAGFERVDDLEEGDVLLAAILSKNINHAAIYLGNNLILHHMANRLSCHDLYSSWHKHFVIKARYIR